MSLIENATRRLEELKRAGVHVPDGLAGPAASPPGPEAPAEESAAGTPEPAVARAEIREFRPERPAEDLPGQRRSNRTSRTVALDLATLAAEGFVTPDDPQSRIAQQFRVIKRPLIANVQGKSGIRPDRANLLMVTSALAGEGKSFCALNLAMSLAMEQDSTVLLVDADVARPSLMSKLRLPDSRGLLDVLTNPGLDLSQVILRTNVGKLSLLPAGTRHDRATELLASGGMARVVEEMSLRYPDRIVVFDSPPLLLTTEAPALASHMGQIVMVVEADRTSVASARQALATIEKCPIVMTLLNKSSEAAAGSYYGYGYGYGQRAAS